MEEPVESPIVVLIDTAEGQPFTFQGMRTDASKGLRPLAVRTRRENLGRHPNSLGDYSVEGYAEQICVERKSREDVQSTILGWATAYDTERERKGHRERFEKELENLAKIPHGLIVVEATVGDCIEQMPEWGTKGRETNAKIWHRSLLSYMRRYKVQWLFCNSRRHAEKATYSWLFQCWRDLERKNP